MRTRTRTIARTLILIALAAAVAVSCPTPIDEELLLVVDDEIAPLVTIASPIQNSLYRHWVDVNGTLRDFSGATGQEQGSVRSLAFSVVNNPFLARTITFGRDGSFSVDPLDRTFAYTPATGAFSFLVDTEGLDGIQFFTFIAEDLNGNTSQQVVTLLQDPIGPGLTVTAPLNGTSWPLLLVVTGKAVNEAGATTGDRIATLATSIGGDLHMLDLQLLDLQGDGKYHGTGESVNFWFEPATGSFEDRFDLSGATTGDKQLSINAEDDRGMATITFLSLIDNNPGPEIILNDAAHPCATVYSSANTTSITMLGWVDPANLNTLTTLYIIESTDWQRVALPFTPDGAGEFSFTFNPRQPPVLSGKLTVNVYAKDMGNRATHETHSIFDDPINPYGTFSVASGATYAANPETLLEVAVSDDISGMYQMRFNNDGGAWNGWESYAGGSRPWTLAAANGTRTVNAQFSDLAGNIITRTDTIILDTEKPSVGTFRIDSGASYTTNPAGSLDLAATDSLSGMYRMRFKNDSDPWDDGDWETYVGGSRPWSLASTDGTRTVHAEFSDNAGNVQTASDTITLDRVGPTISTFVIAGGAWTGSQDVTITVNASDATSGLWQMRFNNDNLGWSDWEAYDTPKTWQLRNLDGTRTVYVEINDHAGNVSSADDSIGLDRSDPNITTFKIKDGDPSTTTLNVTLTIEATDNPLGDPYQMRFSNDGTNWSSWQSYGGSAGWILSSGAAGPRTVYIQVNDRADNTDSGSDGITYSP